MGGLLDAAAADLAADFDALTGDAWDAKVITAQGLTRSASEIPWMRDREVYVHAIDLGAGTTWVDLPADVAMRVGLSADVTVDVGK